MDTVPKVTVHDLVERGVPDDTWLAPVDNRLVVGLVISAIAMVVAIVVSLPLALSAGGATGGWLGAAIVANTVGLGLLIAAGVKTDGFTAGPLIWHQLSVGVVGLGTVDALVLLLPVLAVVVQFVFWTLVVILIAAVFFGVLLAL